MIFPSPIVRKYSDCYHNIDEENILINKRSMCSLFRRHFQGEYANNMGTTLTHIDLINMLLYCLHILLVNGTITLDIFTEYLHREHIRQHTADTSHLLNIFACTMGEEHRVNMLNILVIFVSH